MPRKAKYKHTHKYKKVKIGQKGYEVYRCTIPQCSHFIQPVFLEGRMNVCHSCGQEHLIDKAASLLAKPICRVCMLMRKEETVIGSVSASSNTVNELLDELLGESNVPTKYRDLEDE